MEFTVTLVNENGDFVPRTFSGDDSYKIEDSGALTVRARDAKEPDLVTILHWSPAFWVSITEAPTKPAGGRAAFAS